MRLPTKRTMIAPKAPRVRSISLLEIDRCPRLSRFYAMLDAGDLAPEKRLARVDGWHLRGDLLPRMVRIVAGDDVLPELRRQPSLVSYPHRAVAHDAPVRTR